MKKYMDSPAVSGDAIMNDMWLLADQAFSRTSGAPLVEGNHIRLLKDATENYPAWLNSIGAAKSHIHFESYIIRDDEVGRKFADALMAKAREGVRVRLIYDWLGSLWKTSNSFWERLREGGVEVRCYNPPRLASPFGWLSRDHRKMLAVDGKIAFVSGLCVGRMWAGDPERNIEPWRDTGIEVRGPALADIESAFARIWAMIGDPIPAGELPARGDLSREGEMAVRVVASEPATAGMLRLDQLVTALAKKRLWLADAYYTGTAPYVQALRSAARGGVDVRLLVPGGSDVPILKPLTLAGYNPLLEAGVRIFEWNGAMMHAKTGVADGRWARVGSTNLNVASWLGNCELDVVVEDEPFAQEMEAMYLRDLENSTEIILHARRRRRAFREHLRLTGTGAGGSAGRAAAGAVRIGNAMSAAFTNRRVLEPVESRLMAASGGLLLVLAALFALFPPALLYPIIFIFVWLGTVLLYKSWKLHREGKKKKDLSGPPRIAGEG